MNKIILKSTAALTAMLILAPLGTGAASAASYQSKATIAFESGNDITPPVDPVDPGSIIDLENPDITDPVTPGTSGPLSIDFASSLSFGKQSISTQNETYYAHAQALSGGAETRPNYVQVTDTTGENLGWTLSVKTDAQFHMTDVDPSATPEESAAPGVYLNGAALNFSGGYLGGVLKQGLPSVVKTNNFQVGTADTVIMAAKAGEGAGTWVYGLGASHNGSDNAALEANNEAYQENGGAKLENDAVSTKSPITMTVPGSTVKNKAAYTTNLVWTLSDTPAN